MPVLVCENPECSVIGRGAGPQRCAECRHKLISQCRKCDADIRSSTDTMCWACGASYKLPRPLPPSLLARSGDA
ncbi:MAG: hypothetical protein PVH68_08855 [Armatimonadota bacterium]